MVFRRLLAGLITGGALLVAQVEPPPEAAMNPKEDAIEQILSVRESPEALEKAVGAARALGVSEQAILEARFLFHIDRAEDAEIAALLPEFEKQKADFDLVESEIFASEDDWLAVTEYVRAIAALKQGDSAGFKEHITEAFWLSPKQGAAFAPHIERIRLMDAMKAVKVDFDKKYKDTFGGEMVSLGEVLGEKKGLLLHFWSPWSRECEATLVDFFLTAEHIIPKGVGVVSILPETSTKVNADAKAMLQETGKNVPGQWIVDSKKAPISHKLKVQSVPVVVLLTAEGRVLYNGHPAEENFWKALETLEPRIMRPEMREEE
ncbi:MAG: hypothetical protein IZT59_13005 [Verrucomicrobia bacterium]|jgi:hypothetical protein|nr:hypothetical protein [Verrucomicrobiota bacterium]|tara:strand:+ start:74784 stop:75743 length:960 start_codon:yes stop_codon:yes gene_type:complete